MKPISIPVSPGELLDRIGILRLKAARILDPAKRENVAHELALLSAVAERDLPEPDGLAALAVRLDAINARLWDVEDALRGHEARRDFGPAFVSLARSVYRLNDERAAVKRAVNDLLGAEIVEEKSYGAVP